MKTTINKLLRKNKLVLVSYNNIHKRNGFSISSKLWKRNNQSCECYSIYQIVKEICKKRKGNLAEVGCYDGNSTEIICKVKKDNPLYVYDTFEGLPEINKEKDNGEFKKGMYACPSIFVKKRLKKYPNVFYREGYFPDTTSDDKDKKFIFVNLDVDIYQSTKDCLEFFYPRLENGGILISHDYPEVNGVKEAMDEFMKDKPETLIELAGRQCMFIKGRDEIKE